MSAKDSTHPFLPALGRPLVLASQSPRRAEILRRHGLEFSISVADVDETAWHGEAAQNYVSRLALEKARSVSHLQPKAVYLGADTVVVLDSEILCKPTDEADACHMLARLSAREHVVFSAVALVCADLSYQAVQYRETRVRIRALGVEEIARYVAGGDPMDKAGSYGIQGQGSLMVEGIEGCYFNVMGLPVQALRELWLELPR